jgi:hypothetical protein
MSHDLMQIACMGMYFTYASVDLTTFDSGWFVLERGGSRQSYGPRQVIRGR